MYLLNYYRHFSFIFSRLKEEKFVTNRQSNKVVTYLLKYGLSHCSKENVAFLQLSRNLHIPTLLGTLSHFFLFAKYMILNKEESCGCKITVKVNYSNFINVHVVS